MTHPDTDAEYDQDADDDAATAPPLPPPHDPKTIPADGDDRKVKR